MPFPKISRTISKDLETIRVKYLVESTQLDLDKNKCVGCGVCSKVCPREAVYRGPIGASIKITTEDLVPSIYYPDKCSFCGVCTYMCPFFSLSLKINDKKIENNELLLFKEKALPKLEFELVDCEEIGRQARKYVEGKISVNTDECTGGCSTCIEICPTGAFTFPEKLKDAEGWEKSQKVLLDDKKCIYCGTCDNGCPTGAIKLEITEVKYSGDYAEPFWPDIVERLKKMRKGEKE